MTKPNPFDPTRHSEGEERPGVKPHPSVRKPALAASLILTRQRANGLNSMVGRIREAALAAG